jgi:hypothetical protein
MRPDAMQDAVLPKLLIVVRAQQLAILDDLGDLCHRQLGQK